MARRRTFSLLSSESTDSESEENLIKKSNKFVFLHYATVYIIN